jgi:methylenetetrahydrofolate dehydrogenase (NADP+) / methenyltetrahydrofolate cyclohydrolase
MAATTMDGRALAAKVRAQVAVDVQELGHVGLATILVGDDPASDVYIRLKHKAATEAGIDAVDHRLSESAPDDEVRGLIERLNADDQVDGILVQSPLPPHLDEPALQQLVDPAKDVDGFHTQNAGSLYLGRGGFAPATPLGVMALLEEYDIPVAGAHAVVVGRSTIVGKPAAMLLLQSHATVTICHSRTRDLAHHTRDADILVVAVGLPRVITAEMIKPGAAVIDVGINRTEDGMVGDVDPAAADVAGHLTPVPGGVGPMTIAMLLRNTADAARMRRARRAPEPA